MTVATEGAGQVVTATATDVAGNPATATVTLHVDLTPPVVTLTAPPDVTEVPTESVTLTGTVSDIFLARTTTG